MCKPFRLFMVSALIAFLLAELPTQIAPAASKSVLPANFLSPSGNRATHMDFVGASYVQPHADQVSWQVGNLEIHHINVGQGDSTLIVGPTGKSLLFDAGPSSAVGPYVESVLGHKNLDYVVISHFHEDHIGSVDDHTGLWNLVETQGFTVGKTLLRDYDTYLGKSSGTFDDWKTYFGGAGQTTLHPVTAVEGTSQVDLGGGVVFDILTVDGNGTIIPGNFSANSTPPSENDYSLGALISFGAFDEWLSGDLDGEYFSESGYAYHDIELSVAPEVGDVDVYRVHHHGSDHSSSDTFVKQLDPEVSIISVGNGNAYGHPRQAVMDRLLATSVVYLTERGELATNIGAAIVAGNVVIKTSNGTNYTVNGTAYTATEPARTDADGDGYFAEVDPDDSNPVIKPSLNGGCDPVYQVCTCRVTSGQVLINELLPHPSTGPEWIELYNTTGGIVNVEYCYIDDEVGGKPPYQIPGGTLIQPHGFWTENRTGYFNDSGDEARFLKDDKSTVLDSYSYGSTGHDVSWYRDPDGGAWASSTTSAPTKGSSNNTYPIVASITRADPNHTSATSVDFTVTFSETVTGVDKTDFTLTITGGISGASVARVSGSSDTRTVTVKTGSGDGTLRLNVIDNDSIKDGVGNRLGGTGAGNGNYTSGQIYTVDKTKAYSSRGAYDGHILESTETSGVGGSIDATATTFRLGDDAQDRQYRAILSFDTSPLPDDATISKVTLKIKKQAQVGTNPFTTHGNILVDVKKGAFSSNNALQTADFQAAASKSAAGTIKNTPLSGWYTKTWTSGIFSYVNKTGVTQFRLRFQTDDNNDNGSDYFKFYSGNATTASSRPQLIVEYTTP